MAAAAKQGKAQAHRQAGEAVATRPVDQGMIELFQAVNWQMTVGERAALAGVLADLRPGVAIEIGTAQGGSRSNRWSDDDEWRLAPSPALVWRVSPKLTSARYRLWKPTRALPRRPGAWPVWLRMGRSRAIRPLCFSSAKYFEK